MPSSNVLVSTSRSRFDGIHLVVFGRPDRLARLTEDALARADDDRVNNEAQLVHQWCSISVCAS
jgi:hypothetical protein